MGSDFGATAIADQKQWQFIELYNTTNATIDLAGWMLKFTEGRPVPKSDVDQVSNRAGTGFVVDIGQSGRVTNTRATDATATITAINIVSMYRNINYDKVEKVKADGTADPSREEQLKGIPAVTVKVHGKRLHGVIPQHLRAWVFQVLKLPDGSTLQEVVSITPRQRS